MLFSPFIQFIGSGLTALNRVSLWMVLKAVSCKHCGQTQHVKRYGTICAGTQRYRCYDYARTARRPGFVQTYTHKPPDPLFKEQITQVVLNGAGARDTTRVLGVNRNTVSAQLKKSTEVIHVNPLYVNRGLKMSLKVDEMWSFVGKKK